MHETSKSGNATASRFPIESNRRLLRSSPDIESGFQEYFDVSMATRIISLPAGSEQARYHEELHEERMPVFSALYDEDRLLLLVPEGTRSLGSLLKFVARDMPNYAQIFYELGGALSQMHKASFGLPAKQAGRAILDNFAFVLDESDVFGGNLYLNPPYQLNPAKKIEQEIGALHMELSDTELFSEYDVAQLLDKTIKGWQDGQQE